VGTRFRSAEFRLSWQTGSALPHRRGTALLPPPASPLSASRFFSCTHARERERRECPGCLWGAREGDESRHVAPPASARCMCGSGGVRFAERFALGVPRSKILQKEKKRGKSNPCEVRNFRGWWGRRRLLPNEYFILLASHPLDRDPPLSCLSRIMLFAPLKIENEEHCGNHERVMRYSLPRWRVPACACLRKRSRARECTLATVSRG